MKAVVNQKKNSWIYLCHSMNHHMGKISGSMLEMLVGLYFFFEFLF